MRPTWMPVGRNFMSLIAPIGSASVAICSRPWAMVSTALSDERQAVEHRGIEPFGAAGLEVLGVRCLQARLVAADRSGDGS